MWTQSFKPTVTTTTEEALAAIQDPFQRFRAKATGFVSIKDEFDDFINVSVAVLVSAYANLFFKGNSASNWLSISSRIVA